METPVKATLKALVTVAELAPYLSLSYAGMGQEKKDELQRLINAVSLAIEKHCHQPLIKGEATEFYDGGEAKILLGRGGVDLGAPFVVKEDGRELAPAVDGRSTTAAGTAPDYWLDPDIGVIERCGRWQPGRRIVAVTYTAGWAVQTTTGDVVRTSVDQELVEVEGPEDLREACLIICKAHTEIGPANFGVTMLEGQRYLKPDAWPRTALKLLNPYTDR